MNIWIKKINKDPQRNTFWNFHKALRHPYILHSEANSFLKFLNQEKKICYFSPARRPWKSYLLWNLAFGRIVMWGITDYFLAFRRIHRFIVTLQELLLLCSIFSLQYIQHVQRWNEMILSNITVLHSIWSVIFCPKTTICLQFY